MTISLKKVISIITLVFLCDTQDVLSQTSVLENDIHQIVDYYRFNEPKGERWEQTKKTFDHYTKTELANGLLGELSAPEMYKGQIYDRSGTVASVYRALGLPNSVVLDQLEKTQSPQLTAALIRVLSGDDSPDVTSMLLHKINDHRIALTGESSDAGFPVPQMRICDVACNVLVHNLRPNDPRLKVIPTSSDNQKDQAIKHALETLQLDLPDKSP